MDDRVGENAQVMTDDSIGANKLAIHNCNHDTEVLDSHRNWKMKNFSMDSEVLQLPIKLVSKDTLCKIIGLLCSELQTGCIFRETEVKSCPAENNDQIVEDQETRTDRKSMYNGKCNGSDFRPIRNMRPCSFCSQVHLWGKSRCPSFGRRCDYCGIFNHNSISCWFRQMDNLNHVNEQNCSFSDDVQKEPSKSKPVQASSLSQSVGSNIKETKKPAVIFVSEMGNVVEAETGNVEEQVTIEKDVAKSSGSSTVKSLEASDLDKPLALSEEPHGEDYESSTVKISDDCLVEDEKPIRTVCYWSKIKDNSCDYSVGSTDLEKGDPDKVDKVTEAEQPSELTSTSYETSIEDIDLEQNKRFVEWLLNEIATGNKEIFFDRVLGENILKNGGIVCEKYMEKKRELFC